MRHTSYSSFGQLRKSAQLKVPNITEDNWRLRTQRMVARHSCSTLPFEQKYILLPKAYEVDDF